jgi:hypothetical protein
VLQNPLRNLPPSRVNLLLGIVLFVAAFGYRLVGIGWGLPNDLHNQSYHPDEPVIFAYSQALDPLKGDFDPDFYNYGTLYLTLVRIGTDVAATYSGAAIDEKDPSSVYRYMAAGHMAGRVISALAGAGTVVLLFFMLRRIMNSLGAFLGAFMVLVSPAHAVHSRFQTPDVLATFLLAASAFYALKLFAARGEEGELSTEEAGKRGSIEAGHSAATSSASPSAEAGKRGSMEEGDSTSTSQPSDFSLLRLAIWSGAFAGLSAGTKYTGILGLLTLYAALILTRKPGWWKAALAGTGAAALGFIVGTPGALLNTSAFMRDVKYELAHTATGHGLIFEGAGSGFSFHMFNLVVGLGLFMTILGIGGLAIAAQKKHAWAFALLAFFVPYFILIGRADVMFIRYTFPLYIALAAGFGYLMAFAHEARGRFTAVVVVGIAVLVGLDPFGGLRRSAIMTGWMAGEDSRDEAARYLKSKANSATTVGLVRDPWFWYPPLFKDSTMMRGNLTRLFEEMSKADVPKVIRYLPPNISEKQDWDLRLITESEPDYIVISSFDWEEGWRLTGKRGLSPAAQAAADASTKFREELLKNYEGDTMFGKPGLLVHDLEYIRPNIWIWKRKVTPGKPRESEKLQNSAPSGGQPRP